PQQVMRLRIEQRLVDPVVSLDMFFCEYRAAGGHPADQWQAELFAKRILQLDASRSTGYQLQYPLSLPRAQMFLGGVSGLETKLAGNLRTRGRHAGISDKLLNHLENL